MEELRSTEILDKEIQEDARRKAERILKNADAEVAKISAGVEARINSMRTEKTVHYTNLGMAFERDLEAAFPLEKQRFLVQFQEDAITEAIKAYIASLSEQERLSLVLVMLNRALPVLKGKKVTARVGGFPVADMKQLLEAKLEKGSLISCTEAPETDLTLLGCVLESEDKSVRARVTVNELIDGIIDANRYELVTALFGGRLPA